MKEKLDRTVFYSSFKLKSDAYNLELDGLPVQFYGPDLKVHTDRADVAFCVRVILQRERDR